MMTQPAELKSTGGNFRSRIEAPQAPRTSEGEAFPLHTRPGVGERAAPLPRIF